MKLRYPFVSLDKNESYADIPVTSEISVKSRKIQDSIDLGTEETRHKVRGIGQLRRAKMHISCLIDDLNIKNEMTPALRELLEASLVLQTTSTKILAGYLKRSPATIRSEFLRILSILGERGRYLGV
ncbi:MAG: hypothetical protein AABY99_05945 [Pseudomonadota bacterium]